MEMEEETKSCWDQGIWWTVFQCSTCSACLHLTRGHVGFSSVTLQSTHPLCHIPDRRNGESDGNANFFSGQEKWRGCLNFSAAFKNSFVFLFSQFQTYQWLKNEGIFATSTCSFSPIYLFFLWSPMFLHLSSSLFFPCLDFLFFLYLKKCFPLIFIYIFMFSSSDFKMDCFSCPEICTFPSPGCCPSTDLGGLDALLWW